ncbi:hypothetical protein [Nocardioides sp. SYSU DS0651]|uniref:hypothetical protein n=1 Tax=Nocardioides sp. SYSU DS0651 TaxID=3415955 RepID=UPI003F4C6BF8
MAGSLALMVLLVTALAVQSSGGDGDSDPSENIDIEAIGTLVGMPFQLVGMALGGPLQFSEGGSTLSLFAPPLLVTTLFAVSAYLLSKRAERKAPSASTMERAVLAASGALATAVVATVLTRALAMRDGGAVMHTASIGLFLGTLALGFTASLLGRVAAHGPLWPHWLPPDARRAAHLVAQHVLAWLVVAIPVATVWLMADSGAEAALYALVWGPTVGLASFGLGHLGALTAVGEQQFAWDLGWFPGVALPLLAVVLTLVASIAWHLRRGDDRSILAQPVSWVWLPLAYAAAALTACLVSTVGISGVFFGEGGFTVHIAYWLIPLLAAWGALVETLSRFAAPALAGAMPGPIVRRLAQGPAQLTSPPMGPAQRLPMSPADRARARKALIGAGVVGGIGIVGLVAFSIAGSVLSDPEKQAEAYLDALVDGDADKALQLAPVDGDEASAALMTDDVYGAAEDRISGYDITDVEEFGDTVTVTVDLEGVPEGDGVELTLEEDGSRAIFFTDWKVADGGLASELTVSMPETSSSLEVNGVSITATGGRDVDLWALPGSYAVNPYGDSKWLEPTDTRTTVPASSFGVYAEIESPAPSAALTSHVDAEIETWLNECMAATELDPPGDCPQDAIGYGDEQRNITWTLTTPPTVSWEGFDGTFPATLSSESEGQATVTYEYDESYGFGAPQWTTETEEDSIYLDVQVDLVDDQPEVTFQSY